MSTTTSTTTTTTSEADSEDVNARRDLAASVIYASLTSEAKLYLENEDDPTQMWKKLKNWLNSVVNRVGIIQSHNAFQNERMKIDESISTYISSLMGYQTKLDNSSSAISEQTLVMHILNYLTPKYHCIRRHIYEWDLKNQTLNYVRKTLLEYESNMEEVVTETTALATTTATIQPSGGRKGGCQSRGQYRGGSPYRGGQYCWGQYYGSWYQGHTGIKNQSMPFKSTTRQQQCYHCSKYGHISWDCQLWIQGEKLPKDYQSNYQKS